MSSSYRSRINIPVDLGSPIFFYTKCGTRIAHSYNRVVIGKRGPYIEFNRSDINWDKFGVPKGEEWRLNMGYHKYVEYHSLDDSSVMLYDQLGVVDYADYRIGMIYISPFDLSWDGSNSIVYPARKEHMTHFIRTKGLNQWDRSEFDFEGKHFFTAEQWMMYWKAIVMGDKEIASKILSCEDPHECKELGRKVRNYDEDLWISKRRPCVYLGNKLKYEQNDELREILLATSGTTLVEANPVDKVWSCGLKMGDSDRFDRRKWDGLNLLGMLLTELRDKYFSKPLVVPHP